jgi:hypothetical protein
MSFCGSCGAALNTPAAFCPSCGAKSSQPVAEAAPSTASSPVLPTAAAVKTGSPVMKILLVVAVLGVCAVGALAYAAYWVKNKVETTAAEHGITLPTGGSGGSHRAASNKPAVDPCSLATKEEVSSATGLEISAATVHDSGCVYTASSEAETVIVEVSRGEGSAAMAGARLGGKLGAVAPGTEAQELAGLGDEAVFQGVMLIVRKGDDTLEITLPATLLTANFGPNMDMAAIIAAMRDKAKALAEIVLPRM